MCNQNQVEQRELVALTKDEQRLLKAAPALLRACYWASMQSHHPCCRTQENSAAKCNCSVGAARDAIQEAKSNV